MSDAVATQKTYTLVLTQAEFELLGNLVIARCNQIDRMPCHPARDAAIMAEYYALDDLHEGAIYDAWHAGDAS